MEVAYQLRDVVIIVADDLAFSSQYLPSAVWYLFDDWPLDCLDIQFNEQSTAGYRE